MTTFSPSIQPDTGLSRPIKQRILKSKFGDGYSQRSGDGINTREFDVNCNWTAISETVKDELLNFFDTQGGYLAFDYTLPNSSTVEKFTCEDYGETWQRGTYDFSATLTRVFDL